MQKFSLNLDHLAVDSFQVLSYETAEAEAEAEAGVDAEAEATSKRFICTLSLIFALCGTA